MVDRDNKGTGNRFVRVPLSSGQLRITEIPHGWEGTQSIRLDIEQEDGHVRQGPEFAVLHLGAITDALIELLSQRE